MVYVFAPWELICSPCHSIFSFVYPWFDILLAMWQVFLENLKNAYPADAPDPCSESSFISVSMCTFFWIFHVLWCVIVFRLCTFSYCVNTGSLDYSFITVWILVPLITLSLIFEYWFPWLLLYYCLNTGSIDYSFIAIWILVPLIFYHVHHLDNNSWTSIICTSKSLNKTKSAIYKEKKLFTSYPEDR